MAEEKVLKDGYATYLPPDCAGPGILEERRQLFVAFRSCHRQVQTTTTGPGLSLLTRKGRTSQLCGRL